MERPRQTLKFSALLVTDALLATLFITVGSRFDVVSTRILRVARTGVNETRPPHYSALGLVYYRSGRPEDAVPPFRRITKLQPDLPNGFQSLGAAYHSMGALDQAVSNYEQAIQRGHSWVAHSNLGTIYYRWGEFAEAAEQYEKALELNPNRHVYHRVLSVRMRRPARRRRW